MSGRYPKVYRAGMFNALVNHMVQSGDYDAWELWQIWSGLVSQFGLLATKDGSRHSDDLNGDFDLMGDGAVHADGLLSILGLNHSEETGRNQSLGRPIKSHVQNASRWSFSIAVST